MRSGSGSSPVATTTGRRAPTAAVVVAVSLAIAAGFATGCSRNADQQPTVASVNFGPKLVLEVNDDGFRWRRGDNGDPAVTVDPAAVPFGTVIQVVNTGAREHWVDAGKAFDTGRLHPGDQTIVAFTSDTIGAELQTYDIVDRDASDHRTQVVVQAKPAST